MAIKTRSQLKPYFVKNAIPTEGNFADLIDSALNQSEDGVINGSLTVNDKLKVGAGSEVAALTASGLITANGGLKVKGDAVINGSLTVTGPFTANGAAGLSLSGDTTVDGVLTTNGLKSPYSLALSDYTTLAPASNVLLLSPPKDRDGWVYRDVTDTKTNSGIYHRQLDTAIKGLPANSLGFIGGSALKAYIDMVTGGAYFAGNLALGAADPGANRLHVQGDAAIKGDLAITGSLTITSNAAIKGDLAITKNAAINGSLAVSGPIAANGGLQINGALSVTALTVTGRLSAAADLTIGGWLEVGSNMWVKQELRVDGGIHSPSALGLHVEGKERVKVEPDGTFTLRFEKGFWHFSADGSLVKYKFVGGGQFTPSATLVPVGW